MADDEQASETQIYFERQTRFLCGVHVLNNMVRSSILLSSIEKPFNNPFQQTNMPNMQFEARKTRIFGF